MNVEKISQEDENTFSKSSAEFQSQKTADLSMSISPTSRVSKRNQYSLCKVPEQCFICERILLRANLVYSQCWKKLVMTNST